MAVNWYWKSKKGTLIYKYNMGKEANNEVMKFKVNIYGGNCLGALIYDYKDENTKEDMYTFYGFWNDETHLKRCLGLVKGYNNIYKDDVVKVRLNTYYKDMCKIAPLFAKVGIKVELYYKEPKK